MRSVYSYSRYVALAAILVLVVATMALANGARVTPTPTPPRPTTPVVVQPTQCPMCGMPAGLAGAGPRTPIACASSTTNTAFIYACGDFRTLRPLQTTGSMQMSVMDNSQVQGGGTDTANVIATFTYPTTGGGSQYRVEFTGVDTGSEFGGVALLQPIFGQTGVCAGYNLPMTMGYAVASGTATIMKDGQTIATNQPALAAVTQALHDDNQNMVSLVNTDEQEIHLIVPGSMAPGGTAVPGFEGGGFYVFWPSSAIELRNVGGVVEMTPGTGTTPGIPAVPASPGGPARGPEDFEAPLGTISMSLTNDGIQKAVGTAPYGPYMIQVMNNSSRARGLVFTGVDLAGNQFTRYTNILQPGQSTSFQYFFAPGKVVIRDFLSGQRTATAFTNVNIGPLSSSIVFQ